MIALLNPRDGDTDTSAARILADVAMMRLGFERWRKQLVLKVAAKLIQRAVADLAARTPLVNFILAALAQVMPRRDLPRPDTVRDNIDRVRERSGFPRAKRVLTPEKSG